MWKIVLRYALFALIATVINLGTQWLVTLGLYLVIPGALVDPSDVTMILGRSYIWWLALFAGTGAGFLVKYVLDKRFIFYYKTKTFANNLRTFMLYIGMAVFTTLLFWAAQWLFSTVVTFEGSQYAGGAIGLAAGYTLKYFLDRRFVFVSKADGIPRG